MPFVSPGKRRESTNWSAELYKDAIRRYFETKGYAQTRSSFIEGTFVDMIFVPTTQSKSKAEIWVEAKYSEISIENKDLQLEVIKYLEAWLKLPHDNRSIFYLFVKKAKAPKKWEDIFDLNDLEFLRTWLFKAATIGGNEYVRRSLSERFDEIGEFFVKSWAYSWDLPELQSAIEESEEESILSFKRSVGRELAEMDKRMAVGSQKDNLIGNMINVIPPKTFVKVEYDSVLDEYLEQNKHDFPPFAKLSFNEMITLNDTSVLERFKTLNGKETILHIDELEDTHQNSLNYLLNQLVGRMFEKIGARCVDDSNIYYFPLQNPLTPMKILGAKNKPVMVAKPLLVKGDSSEDAWPLDLGYIKPREKEINFGFHKGFRVSTIKLWDRYFVSLNLRKVYSKDGRKLMEGERSKKIDRYFRNSKYSHGDSFKSVILALFYQLKKTRDEGKFGYFSQMEFKDVLSLETSMSPVTFGLSQSTLELEFEDEMEDGDES